MQQRNSSLSSLSEPTNIGNELPSWIFDIDDCDDFDPITQNNSSVSTSLNGKSILEELEINPTYIYRNIIWMFLGPCYRLAGHPYRRHPLQSSSTASKRQNIDFWGPCAVISVYSLLLWLGRVREVPWIYLIWTLAAIMNHMVSRVWYHSSLMLHVSLLGYSAAPIIPTAAIILIFRPPLWLATVLEFISVVWASLSAIASYATVVSTSADQRVKLRLLYPTAILMALYLTSLLPVRR